MTTQEFFKMSFEEIQQIKLQLPLDISSLISNSPWIKKTEGKSGDSCFLVSLQDGNRGYLKSYNGKKRPDYKNEIEIVNWLNGKFSTSKILAHGEKDYHRFILWSQLDGMAGNELVKYYSSELIIKLCAENLKCIHQLPIQHCPSDKSLKFKIPEAITNADDGLVELDDLDKMRKDWSLVQIKEALYESIPDSEDLVFTHGDFCLPNIIFRDTQLSGLIDLGRAGVADRYQDIALALRSLKSNLNQDCDSLFQEHYKLIKNFDHKKIAFYLQ